MKALFTLLLLFVLHSAICQDTLTVTFYVVDSTRSDTNTYAIMDAYGDTITSNRSSDWIQQLPGYIIDGQYYNVFYEYVDPKFKILNFSQRVVRKPHYYQ